MSQSVMYLIHWRVQGIPNANWHTFMVWRRVFIICKQKTIDNCTWNLSLKFIEVRIFYYRMPVIGKNMISWFYAYVEHSEIKKNQNSQYIPFILSWSLPKCQNPYYLIHWRVQGILNANWHTFMVWIKERLPNNIIKRYVNVNEWMLFQF